MSRAVMSQLAQTIEQPIPSILELLERTHQHDKVIEQRAKIGHYIMVVGLIGACISFATGAILDDADYWLGVKIGGAIAIVGFLIKRQLRARDYPDEKLTLIKQFLNTIAVDTEPNLALSMDVDFRDYESGINGKHEWLSISGRLRNGHTYCLSVQDKGRTKVKQKRKYTRITKKVRSTLRLKVKLTKNDPITAQAVIDQLDTALPERQGRYTKNNARDQVIDVRWVVQRPDVYTAHEGLVPTQIQPHEPAQIMMWVYNAMAKAKQNTTAGSTVEPSSA